MDFTTLTVLLERANTPYFFQGGKGGSGEKLFMQIKEAYEIENDIKGPDRNVYRLSFKSDLLLKMMSIYEDSMYRKRLKK